MAFPRRELLIDLGLTVVVGTLTQIAISTSNEVGARPRDIVAYALGIAMVVPLLVWRRWPLVSLVVSAVALFAYYAANYPGISPALPLGVPLYATAVSGRLRWAVVVPSCFVVTGFFFMLPNSTKPPLKVVVDFLPHIVVLAAAVLLGEAVRSRRALAAEVRDRLRRAEEDREREGAGRVVEERLRIARELHDTVAHSMATIAVQAGGALHVLAEGPDDVRTALTAIRDTSKEALGDMRATLGVLRQRGEPDLGDGAGLDRLPALLDAVRAAGVPVTFETSGPAEPLDAPVDHAAYRILQESLTNVLRHAGPSAGATVRISYKPVGVSLEVADDGVGAGHEDDHGHGLTGMRERAEAVGGMLTAGTRSSGGFAVVARLPRHPAIAP